MVHCYLLSHGSCTLNFRSWINDAHSKVTNIFFSLFTHHSSLFIINTYLMLPLYKQMCRTSRQSDGTWPCFIRYCTVRSVHELDLLCYILNGCFYCLLFHQEMFLVPSCMDTWLIQPAYSGNAVSVA